MFHFFSFLHSRVPSPPNIPTVATASERAHWRLNPCGRRPCLPEWRRYGPKEWGRPPLVLFCLCAPTIWPQAGLIGRNVWHRRAHKALTFWPMNHQGSLGESERIKDLQRGRRLGHFWAYSQVVGKWIRT